MAEEVVIGDLKVRLRLNDKDLDVQIKKSKSKMDDLQVAATKIGKQVGLAIAAVSAAVAGAITLALKRADDLSKAAQKIGIGTASLSRLAYAGDLADVSLDTLTQSMGKLNRNLSEVASGGGEQVRQTLNALDVSIKNVDGSLRDSDEVFADIADRFARMEEGPRKTAMAMDLFGRSGAQLIPLLNEGRDGLKELADEADRLGITIDDKTGRAAERFNDSLTRLWKGVQGVATRVAVDLLPQLDELIAFFESPEFAQAAQSFARGAVTAIQSISQAIVGIINASADLFAYLESRGQTLAQDAKGRTTTDIRKELAEAQRIIDDPNSNSVAIERSKAWQVELQKELNLRTQIVSTWGSMASAPVIEAQPDRGSGTGGEDEPFVPGGFATGPTEDELQTRLDTLREALATEAELEATNFADRQAQLADFLEREMITKAEYDELFAKAEKEHWENIKEIRKGAMSDLEKFNAMSWDQQAKTVFGELERITSGVKEENAVLFAINRAAAVANAVINTYEGVSKSLSAYPMPLAAIMAGVHAAAGFAQVSSILATGPNTTGGSAKGLSGAASAADAATAANQGSNQSVMYVKGLDPSSIFTGSSIRTIAEGLLQYQKDGGVVVFE